MSGEVCCDGFACGAGLTCTGGLCQPPTSGDDGGVLDAGAGGDAGSPDAGGGAPLGAPCADSSSSQAPGECAGGLTCVGISRQNVCTLFCGSNSDCGTSGSLGNICYEGACLLGCDPTTGNPCGRSDYLCVPDVGGGNVCLPDCTQQSPSYCFDLYGYPDTICDDSDPPDPGFGQCGAAGGPCGSGAAVPACANGQECYARPESSPAVSVCVEDCTLVPGVSCAEDSACPSGFCDAGLCSSCPRGTTCDAVATHTCQITTTAYYGLCTVQANCPAGNLCVSLGSGSVCLATCSADAQCAALSPSSTCSLMVANGQPLCGEPCVAGTTLCATGTTCRSLPGFGDFCAP